MAWSAMTLSEFEGVLKVTGSHVYDKSGSVLKAILDKDVETAIHKQEVICRTAI